MTPRIDTRVTYTTNQAPSSSNFYWTKPLTESPANDIPQKAYIDICPNQVKRCAQISWIIQQNQAMCIWVLGCFVAFGNPSVRPYHLRFGIAHTLLKCKLKDVDSRCWYEGSPSNQQRGNLAFSFWLETFPTSCSFGLRCSVRGQKMTKPHGSRDGGFYLCTCILCNYINWTYIKNIIIYGVYIYIYIISYI